MTQPRHLLAVAYHFPPIQASSGVHRTLAFTRFLGAHGWQSTVLTVHPRAYTETRAANLELVPPEVEVVAAAAWDTQRHLALGGRYLRAMALPDRWASWIIPAFLRGLRAIQRHRSSAIFSTFPIASAHVVGLLLHRATGLPWIADFRDPMLQDTYPADPWIRRTWGALERATFARAARIIVTTPGTADYYRRRYGTEAGTRIRVIQNGFDPGAFPADFAPAPVTAAGDRPLTLLHSGILYPYERDPLPFFRALAGLVHGGDPAFANLRVVFRGSGHDANYAPAVAELGLAGHVAFAPALPYRDALREMLAADALLVFQAANCNNQIPAKAYEYLYAGRPVIGLTDPRGDTGRLLTGLRVPCVAALEDEAALKALLTDAVARLRAGSYAVPDRAAVQALSREARTAELAGVLAEVTPGPAPTAVTRPA
jgi:glycosyltransferase involved in cell wall biosynthesis